MVGAPTWGWLSRRVEAEVLNQAINYVGKVLEVAKAAHELFRKFKEGDYGGVKEFSTKVHELEEGADKVKREVLRRLSEGYIHPVSREELVRLVLILDDVAAYIKAAARRASLVNPKGISETIREYAEAMSAKVLESVEAIRECVEALGRNPKEALEIANKVETLEEEVDELRIKALTEVLKFCDTSKPSLCIVSKEVIDSIENAEDKCEEVADVLRSIAIMRT